MKVKTTEYGNIKEILKYPDHYVGKAVMVSATGVAADSDGRKIVAAGTIVGGSATGTVTAMNDANSEGVLLSDTEVTYGDAPGTVIIHGFIDKDKIPTAPAVDAIAALNMIKFL